MATQLDSLGENQFLAVRDINHPRQDLIIDANNLNNDSVPYKVYTALLTQSGGDNFQSKSNGLLTIGITYTIFDNIGNPDFTNVGAPNNNEGTSFVATGTTPNSWGDVGDATVLTYNTGAPVVTVLENTIGNVWFGYGNVGYYSVNSNSLFNENKSTIIIGNVTWDGGSGYISCGFDGSSLGIINQMDFSNNPVDGGSLKNTLIEIRVYN